MSIFSDPAKTQGSAHDCGDSRLRCVDCSATVCPKCMVSCPVGNRCGTCSKTSKPVARRPSAAQAAKQLVGCAFLLGVAFTWLEWNVGNYLSFCFYIAFLAAGMQAGSRWKRDKTDRALMYILGSFLLAMFGSTAVFSFTSGLGLAVMAFVPSLLNTACVAIGFLVGQCGFG